MAPALARAAKMEKISSDRNLETPIRIRSCCKEKTYPLRLGAGPTQRFEVPKMLLSNGKFIDDPADVLMG